MIKTNLIANFSGGVWTSILSILFIPFYIKLLGMESYGLIGIYGSFIGIFGILDMGLSSTLNRKIASTISFKEKNHELRDFVRTVEIIFWSIGILLALIIFVLSTPITNNWLNFNQLDSLTVKRSIFLMGFIIAAEWPMRCYYGGLRGLQKQLPLNIIKIFIVTIQNVGALLLLIFYSSTIETFFIWQASISLLHTIIVGKFLWINIPKDINPPKFNLNVLKSEIQFTKGLFGISLISLLMSQSDKIILSKMLDLKVFAYYIFALNITQLIFVIAGPFYTTLFPKFCELVSLKKEHLLSDLYHKGSQFLSVLIFPIAMILIFYSREIIIIWSGDYELANNTMTLISIACIGFTINGLMQIPYALQLSNGWTKLSLLADSIGLVIFIPLMITLIYNYNAIGAIMAKAIIFLLNSVFVIHFMHKKLLINEKYQWVLYDIIFPLLISFLIVLIAKVFQPNITSNITMLLFLISVYIFTMTVAVLMTRHPKNYFISSLK